MSLLKVDENSAFAWHSKDAETPEANRENKKLKPSVPDKKDAETPTRRLYDLMKKYELQHSRIATNSQPDILSEGAIAKLKKLLEVKNYPASHPDIFKDAEDVETLEEYSRCVAMNGHQDILKKGAAGVEARSKCLDDMKKKFEKIKNDTNSHPDFLKKADILKKEVENMEACFQFLDFMQKHFEKLMSSVKVPISTEREEDEAERKSYEDSVKKGHKLFHSFGSVFGGFEKWDEARKVFSDLQ